MLISALADGAAQTGQHVSPGGGMYRADFTPFAQSEALVLAVSGGPDSMALLLLAADWMRHLLGVKPALHVATVDHGLRPGSSEEAASVAAMAASLSLSHATLVWQGDKPTTRIQERARTARYALLADHARSVGAPYVLTAHHAEDQAETILLRLGRGSGVAGLAGMRPVTPLAPDVSLVRPLLERSKSELVAVCHNAGCRFVEDPSNRNARFARVKLRAKSHELESLGLGRDALARLGRRMARADEALEAEATRRATRLDVATTADRSVCSLVPLASAAPEIRLRVLGRLIRPLVPSARLRLERLEDLAAGLFAALELGARQTATIAGTVLSLDARGVLTIRLEAPRRRGRSG